MAKFSYPVDMIDPLFASWPEGRRREAEVPPLIERENLKAVLEVTYHASFTFDEQRKTRFSAVICAPEVADRPLRFVVARPYTVHELMRLAPIAAERSALIGVECINGAPQIWGLCDDTYMQLKITVVGAGALSVGRNERRIISLRGGQLVSEVAKFDTWEFTEGILGNARDAAWEGVNFEPATWSPQDTVYAGYLYSLTDSIRKQGHGGLVLLVPDSDVTESAAWRTILRIKYECDDPSIWSSIRKAIARYHENAPFDLNKYPFDLADEEVKYMLARIAGLSAVDGAVLITDRFRVLGFGAEVSTTAPIENVLDDEGNSWNIDQFGTRHRSAFRFCSAYTRGAAVVCSQDGGVRYVRVHKDKIVMVSE